MPDCTMLANGESVKNKMEQTVRKAGLNDGDILQFQVSWIYRMELSAKIDKSEPDVSPPTKPDISPPTFLIP